MQSEELIVIAQYNSYTEAIMAKSLIESAGFYAELRNLYMSTTYGGAIPMELMVRYQDAEQAKELLEPHL